MSGNWLDDAVRNNSRQEQNRTQQPQPSGSTGGNWLDDVVRRQQQAQPQKVSQIKQPKTASAEALQLPTIGAAEQVRQGLVGAAAIQTARDDRSANRQAGRGFSALAEGGITAAPAGTTGKRTAPLTKAQAEEAYARVGQLETEISAMEARLEESWNAMQQQETRISQMEQRLQTLYAELEKNPTQSGMEMYNQAYHQYERAWAEYMNGYRSYEAAYRGYEGTRKQYEDSLTTYNDYISLFVKDDGSYDYEALTRAAQEEYDAYTGTEAYRQEQAAAFTPGSAYLTGGTTQPSQQGSGYLTGGSTPQKETSRAEELKIMADYYRHMADREKDAAVTAANLKALESWSEEDRRLLELVIDTRTGGFGNLLESMGAALSSSGAAQKAAYGHQTAAAQALSRLSEKYGEQTVLNLAESLSRSRNQEMTQAVKDSAAAGAYGLGGATGSSILSVGANLAGSILAPIGALSEWATSTGQYKTLDANNLGMVANAYAGQVRKTVADQIRGGGSAVGQAGAAVYESGMSAIDNFMRIIATGGSEIGSLALAGTGSFGQTVAEASANGASPEEALLLGAAAGFIEVGTEKLPLERLLAQARNAPSGLKKAIAEIAKQAGTEIMEEEISLLSNTLLEMAVLQDTASYRMRIGELMDSGSSYAEAVNTANEELFKEIVTTAIQSGLSGSMMSGATIGFSYLTETPEQRAARRVQRQHEGPEAQLMANGNQIEVQLETGTATAVQLSTRGNVSIVEGLTVAEEKAKIAGRLSELLGRDIVFYEKTREGDNGYYSGRDGRIYLATKNNRIVEQTVGHELTHSIEQAGAYRDLADIVMRRYDAAGVDVERLRQEIRERYAAGGHELATQDDVDRELVAEYVEQYLLSDEKSIRAVCRENRSLGQKIHDWLTNLLAKLGSKRAQGDQFLIQVRDIYAKALAESRGSFTEQTAPAAKPAQPAADAGKTVSQANTGNPDVDQLIRFFEEQFAAGEISREEMQENIDSVKAQAAGKTAAPEPDESRMEGLSLPTLEDGQMADSDEDDDYSRDRHEIMLEDQEVAGKALSYSYGGTNARGADMEELKRAKVMASQNVDPETIRQETGWFRGSDGKWRFEIDDREMTYDRRGNHRGAADRRSAEEDLKIVRDDLFRDMPWEDRPKVIDWARAEHNGNRAEAQEIYDELGAEYGMEFYEYTRAIRRVWETSNAPRGGFLPDYISHPTLFDHYPELNRVAVVIEPLDGSTRGEYRPRSNTIALSENLMEGAEETILHEIQHVIQEIEGFARGSNPRFWEEFQKGATPIRTNDGKIARLEARIEEILDGLPENVAAQFQRFDELEKTDSQEAYAIAEELGEGPWAKQFSDYFMTVWDLELARQYNRARNANDLYRNTAGEIEARDTAARRSMTPEERKNTPPDLGGEETVFMEGTADPASYVGTTAEGVEIYETSEEVRKLPWAERKKRFLDLMRNQYRGRTAKFVRNGHSYYAKFDYRGVSKNIYGDDKSNDSGRDAKINVGADGGIFELVENARFRNSLPETGKQGPVHNSVQYWDYFVKTVQIDGKAYDVVANVRRKADGDYVYLIEMHENTKIEASLPEDSQNSGLSGAPNTSVVSVSNAVQDVKRYSVSNEDSEGRMLTPEQKRFFRNSKVRDAQGRLQAVYHGTQSMGFTIFDPAKSDDGTSLFFSALKRTARTYSDSYGKEQDTYAIDRDTDLGQFSREPDEGRIQAALREAGYEPTSGELITDRAEAEAFAEGIRKAYRETARQEGAPKDRIYKKQMAAEMTDLALTGSNGWYRVSAGYLGEELLIDRESAEQMASQSDGPGKGLYEVYLNLTNPFVLDCKGREWNDIGYDVLKGEGVPRYEGSRTRDVTAWAKANGYDGVIFENVVDLGAYEAHANEALGPDTVYVAFSPEQVKSTANKTPTSNPDIRYSVGRPGPEGLSLPTVEDGQDVKSLTPHRDQLPAKARDYLGRAENRLLRKLQEIMSVPGGAKQMVLKPLVQQISEEYLREGRISDQRIDELFEQAWTRGVIVDTAYFEQYREVKNYLRTTGVSLSRQDQADIADFGDFKKRAFGSVRIVNDGLPVDTAYGELHTMAPELFPESITHPADQLARMLEVAQGIRKTESTLEEYYRGEYGEDGAGRIKRDTRHEFDQAVGGILTELRDVKQYAQERAEEEERETAAPMTPQEAMAVYGQLKEARRLYERANAMNLLKEADRAAVNKLLEGRLTLEDLDPAKENVRAVTEVYEAKAEYERLAAEIRRYKHSLRAAMRKKADSYLQTALQWKDKAVGIAYSRETMERNIRDIVPDRDLAKQIIREYFTPVHRAEADSNRFRNEYRDRVRGLELSRKVKKGNTVSEAHAVQLLGEATDNIAYLQKLNRRNAKRDGKTLEEWQAVVMDLWEQNPGLDQGKIENAVKEFRKIYDELFQRMNEVRVANGYEPVNYRQGYFPHFQPGDGDGILGAFGRAVGIDTQVAALPTTINGLTHTFKPGITWFGNAQERLGFNTAYDAVEGFDKYIEGVASVIHHTENIQKLRALATQIRYNASDEGIKKQVDAIIARTELTEDEKQALINDIYGKARYNLSNFVTELEEYTNLLANKKSKLDRTTEALIGRRCYTFMKAWESRVGANMIAGNLTSAMTNFIPITQAAARTGYGNMLKGMWDSLKEMKTGGDVLGQSSFLANRRGSDPLVKTWVQKASNVAGLPMELIDNFTSGAVLRAAYYHGLGKGLSEAEAMEQADSFAAGVMADRSKGSMPTLFESTNPLFKLFTQFQLEVNNQWSEVLKDLPAEVQENYPDAKVKQVAALTGVMLQYFLGALLYNEAYEYFVGRRPAMDPFGILNDTVGDLTGYELPNLVQWGVNAITGEETDFETEKVHFGDAMANLATNVAGELPFSSALALAGIEVDNGRVPAASAIPDLTVLKDVLFNPDWSDAKRLKEAEDELWKLSYILPPFGGNQLQKIWKGLKVYFEGGSYTVNSAGEEMLQYPVFRDEDGMDWMTAVQAAMMGKSSLTEAQDWVNEGFNSLGAKQTAAYRDLLEAGVDDRDAWDLLRRMSDAEAGEDETKQDVQRVILSEAEIPEAGKAIVYYGLLASESERELMDQMADAGTEQDRLYGLMLQWRRIGSAKGAEKKLLQYDLVAGFAGTDQEKGILAAEILGTELVNENGNPTAYADYLNATQAGLEPGDFFRMRYEGVNMDDYFGLTDQGLRPEEARDLLVKLEDLQPPEGEDEVEDVQRWRTCVDFSGDEAIQLAALRGETSDSLYLKFELATQMGVSLDSYVGLYEIREQFDANGNGSYTNAEVKAAIDSMTGYQLTAAQKAVLWQLMTGSTSSKNNPYSPQVGQQVIDARKAQKEGQ